MNSSSFFEDLRGLHHTKCGEWVPTVTSQGACPNCMGTPATWVLLGGTHSALPGGHTAI